MLFQLSNSKHSHLKPTYITPLAARCSCEELSPLPCHEPWLKQMKGTIFTSSPLCGTMSWLLITTGLQLERITITIWKVLKAQLRKHVIQLNWLILTNDWSAWPKWTNPLWHYLLLLRSKSQSYHFWEAGFLLDVDDK